MVPPKPDKGREKKGKGKAHEDPHKKRKLVHSSGSSGSFGTTMSHSDKSISFQPKLMESFLKVVKIEAIWRVKEEEAREETVREAEIVEALSKPRPARTPRKSISCLVGHEKE